MKNLYITIIISLISQIFQSQNIDLQTINSSNVLELYKQNQLQSLPIDFKSVDISVQIGNGNVIEIIDKVPNYIELMQIGNYNTTLFVNPNDFPTNAEIKVNGSGNYIDITGSNSISDGMKININANDMTIFMRNY